jgi:hypothetical protein
MVRWRFTTSPPLGPSLSAPPLNSTVHCRGGSEEDDLVCQSDLRGGWVGCGLHCGKPKIILNWSCLQALTCAANMGDLWSVHRSVLRKGVLGSCNKAASQAAGRALAGLTGSCCRGAGHEEGEKEGSRGLPRQKLSKSTLFAFFVWAVLYTVIESAFRSVPWPPLTMGTCHPSEHTLWTIVQANSPSQ